MSERHRERLSAFYERVMSVALHQVIPLAQSATTLHLVRRWGRWSALRSARRARAQFELSRALSVVHERDLVQLEIARLELKARLIELSHQIEALKGDEAYHDRPLDIARSRSIKRDGLELQDGDEPVFREDGGEAALR